MSVWNGIDPTLRIIGSLPIRRQVLRPVNVEKENNNLYHKNLEINIFEIKVIKNLMLKDGG